VPLLSKSSHKLPSSLSSEKLEALTTRIQFGGDEVVKAKDGAGSATLSMAYAGAEFAAKVIDALSGKKGLVAPSYVHLDADKEGGAALKKEIGKELDYFSTNVEIGVSLRKSLRCLSILISGIAEWCAEDLSSGRVDRIRVDAYQRGHPRTRDQHHKGKFSSYQRWFSLRDANG
jgi:hypothetical protein